MDTELLVLGGLVAFAAIVIGGLLWRQKKAQSAHRPAEPAAPSRRQSQVGGGEGRALSGQRQNWVIGQSGPLEDKAFHIGNRTVTIGRGVGNFIQIDDDAASERHALLNGTQNGLQVTDMNSSNGTVVNGRALSPKENYDLRNGDVVEFGDSAFLFRAWGDYDDFAPKHRKTAAVAEQTEMRTIEDLQSPGGAGGGSGAGKTNMAEEIHQAVQQAGGDYALAAKKVGLNEEIVRQIVEEGS